MRREGFPPGPLSTCSLMAVAGRSAREGQQRDRRPLRAWQGSGCCDCAPSFSFSTAGTRALAQPPGGCGPPRCGRCARPGPPRRQAGPAARSAPNTSAGAPSPGSTQRGPGPRHDLGYFVLPHTLSGNFFVTGMAGLGKNLGVI